MTFLDKVNAVRNESIDYIKSILNFRGTEYQLTDPSNYDDEEIDSDELFKLPIGVYVNKHGFHLEYNIVMVNINDGVLSFVGIDPSEGDEHTFSENDMYTVDLCYIADLIYSFEN